MLHADCGHLIGWSPEACVNFPPPKRFKTHESKRIKWVWMILHWVCPSPQQTIPIYVFREEGGSSLLPRKELTEHGVHKPGSRVAWLYCQNIQIIMKRKPFLSAFNNTGPPRTRRGAYSSAAQYEQQWKGEPWKGGDQAPQTFPPAHPTLPHTQRLNNDGENLEQARWGPGGHLVHHATM